MKMNISLLKVLLACGSVLAESNTSELIKEGNGSTGLPPHLSANFCTMDKDQLVGTTCDVTFHEINEINNKIRPEVERLVETDFFRYFKLDLFKECPFWEDNNRYCVNRACAVDIVEDWDSVPEIWRPEALGGLDEDTVKSESEGSDECAFLDQLCSGKRDNSPPEPISIEYCDVEDFTNKGSVLVDLKANPERFTGYGGEQSSQIWSAIYKENCFTLGDRGHSLAKNVFYRLVSGLHASIGTHLSNDYLNTETGEWGPNLELFMARVGNYPERVANIYFNFAIVAKALWKIQPHLEHIEFCNVYDNNVKGLIHTVVSQLDSKIFNEDLLFQDDFSSIMKNDFRSRFKNVTKIMDCVHCDRCRMWGKVQTTGYATSLKILFEMDTNDEVTKQRVVDKLTKYELIALFNTFDRISKSVTSINNFERMYNEQMANNMNTFASFFQNNFFSILGRAHNSVAEAIAATPVPQEPLGTAQLQEKDFEGSTSTQEFQDLRMPPKSAIKHTALVDRPSAFQQELASVREALRFIWQSYIYFPRNMFYIILFTANNWFNRFIGLPK